MRLSKVFLGLVIASAMAGTAQADSLSPWGMWSDGAELRKSKKNSAPAVAAMLPPSALGVPPTAQAAPRKSVALAQGGAKPAIQPAAPDIVAFDAGYAAGEVVIDTAGRKLYFTLPDGQAYVYPVAVGKQGFTWSGTEKVSKVVDWPDWVPPEEMRQRKPGLPLKMTGGVNNPLGAKAIYLGHSLYRIHGTNDAKSIGTAASSGCIRMHNGHVVHLAGLVHSGTVVHVVKKLPQGPVTAPPKAVESQNI